MADVDISTNFDLIKNRIDAQHSYSSLSTTFPMSDFPGLVVKLPQDTPSRNVIYILAYSANLYMEYK
jgi:hypothetical protein